MATPEKPDYEKIIAERIPIWDGIWKNTSPGDREKVLAKWRELGKLLALEHEYDGIWAESPAAMLRQLRPQEPLLFINPGVNDACWLGDYLYLDSLGWDIFKSGRQREEVRLWAELSRECSFIVGMGDQEVRDPTAPGGKRTILGRCFFIDRPREVRWQEVKDRQGRRQRVVFHCPDGPAVVWRDGTCTYQYQGITVKREVIEEPEKITSKAVMEERNAEVRRIMLIKMGLPRFIKEAGGKVLDSKVQPVPAATWGRLGLKPSAEPVVNEFLELSLGDNFTHWVVRVVDPSTLREYVLGVPNPERIGREIPQPEEDAKSLDGALGWTFQMTAREYRFLLGEN